MTARQPSTPVLIAVLLACIGYGLIAMTLCLPSMAQWSTMFAVSQASVQLSFSAYVVAFGFAQIIYGPLSDRFGRRRILICGLLIALLGSVLSALASTMPALIAARFIQGAGTAAGMVLGRAMVQDFFSGDARPRVMAYIGMVLGCCPPAATIIGGQLHITLGWRASFVLAAVLAVMLIVASLKYLPKSMPVASSEKNLIRPLLRGYRTLFSQPRYLTYVAILACCTGSFYAFLASAPSVFASYGVGPGMIGWYIALIPAAYIGGNFLTSRLLSVHSEFHIMLGGQFVTLIGIGIVIALSTQIGIAALWIAAPLTLLGLGHGLLMPSTLAGTVGVIPALAGTAAAGAGFMQQITGAFGGYVVGFLPHHNALAMGLLLFAFMLFSVFSQCILMRLPVESAQQ